MNNDNFPTLFNSPLETGIRSLTILYAAYPAAFDLERLLVMDYLVVHSGDANGPKSLHTPLPMRGGELLIRRDLIKKGLLLMMSRGLIEMIPEDNGFNYQAGETAAVFLSYLSTNYSRQLMERADWVTSHFEQIPTEQLSRTTYNLIKKEGYQFLHSGRMGVDGDQ